MVLVRICILRVWSSGGRAGAPEYGRSTSTGSLRPSQRLPRPSPWAQLTQFEEDIPELVVTGLVVLAIATPAGHAWEPMIATAARR